MDAFGFALIPALLVCTLCMVGHWLLSQRKRCFQAFEGTGIPGPPVRSLLNGNADEFWKPNQIESLGRWLEQYGDIFGFYLGDVPFVVVKDPDMINEIFAREFNVFSGRGNLMNIHVLHPILERNMVFIKGRDWKAARNCMSQFFTSAKLKAILPSMVDAQREFLEILAECADSERELDITKLCERLTFDVISRAAFNMDTSVQRHPEEAMLFQAALSCFPKFMTGFFYNMGQNLYQWPRTMKAFLKLIGPFYVNPVAEMTKLVSELIKYRQKNPQINVPDMAQFLLDDALGKNKLTSKDTNFNSNIPVQLSQEKLNELAINSVNVLLGGYDTTRLAMTSWFYLMGKHPDVQERMREEILEAFQPEGDQLSLQTLTALQYTSQVLSEVLRMYPPFITFTTRRSEQDYRCGKYLIKKGMSVMVPTYHLHHDPKHWPNPDEFDPDRFSPENKHSIRPEVYQPFGLGVRVCVGQRLALLELASVASQVLRRYRIALGPSQNEHLELCTYSFMAVPKENVWVQLRRINDN